MIASVTRDTDRRVALWDLDGKPIENFKGHTNTANQIKFQPLQTPNLTTKPLLAQTSPDTCVQGYVWREATPTDLVCVTPETRSQAKSDNQQASSRRSRVLEDVWKYGYELSVYTEVGGNPPVLSP